MGLNLLSICFPWAINSFNSRFYTGLTPCPTTCISLIQRLLLPAGDAIICWGTTGMFFGNAPLFHIFLGGGGIVSVKNAVAGTSIVPSPRICLLGLFDDLLPTTVERTLLGLLLFYFRKAFTLCCKQSTLPSVRYCQQLVNATLPLCLKKFSKVWVSWLNSASTVLMPDSAKLLFIVILPSC